MKTKMTKTEALLIQFLLAFLLFLHVNAVDPVFFLISKTFIENKTLVPLPEDLEYKGDPVNDCCTTQIIVEVTDYEEPDEGSGIESPKRNESQPETGEIAFLFDHPNIRNEDVNFTVVVNEKDEGLTIARHVLQFDKCLKLAQKTFNFSAESTMATMKDVKMIIVNGKDDNIDCINTNVIKAIVQTEYKTALIVVCLVCWLNVLVLLVCYKLYTRRNLKYQNTNNQNSMQLSNIGPDIENNEIKGPHEESGHPGERNGPGDSTSDSDEERGVNETAAASNVKMSCGVIIGSIVIAVIAHYYYKGGDKMDSKINQLFMGDEKIEDIPPLTQDPNAVIDAGNKRIEVIKEEFLDTIRMFIGDPDKQITHKHFSIKKTEIKCLAKNWKSLLSVFFPDKSESLIHSVKELYDIEELEGKFIETLKIIQKYRRANMIKTDLFWDVIKPYLDTNEVMEQFLKTISTTEREYTDQSLAKVQISHHNFLHENNMTNIEFQILQQHWEEILSTMIPNFSFSIIEAIHSLSEMPLNTHRPIWTKEIRGPRLRDMAIKSYTQIQRFSKMGLCYFEDFSRIMKLLKQNQLLENFQRTLFAGPPFSSYLDITIHEELPENLEAKNDLIQDIEGAIENIQQNGIIRKWLLALYKMAQVKYSWEDFDEENYQDLTNANIAVVNILYGNKTHCIVKVCPCIPSNDPALYRKLDLLQHILQLALEKIDCIQDRKKTVKPSLPMMKKNKEVNIDVRWSGLRKTPEDKVREILLEAVRKMPENVDDTTFVQELVDSGVAFSSAGELKELFESTSFYEKDATKVSVTLYPSKSSFPKVLCNNMPIWPYKKRRLSEIDDTTSAAFIKQCVKILPKELDIDLISNLEDVFKGNLLYKVNTEVNTIKEPFCIIFKLYQENEGTFEGWLLGLEKCRDDPGVRIKKAFENEDDMITELNKVIEGTIEVYNTWYKGWEQLYKDLPKLITNYAEFEGHFTMHGLSNFHKMKRDELKRKVKPGDQIWLWRDKMGGYAHVLIYIGDDYIVHVHGNTVKNIVKRRGTASLVKDNLDNVISETDNVFIVRIDDYTDDLGRTISEKAKACADPEIEFDYNGFSGNCETFANAMFGEWSDERATLQGCQVAASPTSFRNKKKMLAVALNSEYSTELRDKIWERLVERELERE